MSAELNGRLTPTGVLVGNLNQTGGGGTDNYNDLVNKPSVNGVTLAGNKTSSDLGINIPTKVSQLQNDSHFVQQSAIPTKTSQLQNDSGFAYSANLATVATTGSYNNLTDKPTIPTKTSQLQNDSGFITGSGLATVATTGSYNDLTNKPTIPTKTSELDNDSGFVEASELATVATTGSYDDLTDKPELAAVATSGSYDDLTDKPTIPAAQVNSDWNSNSGVSQILNKPTIPVNSDFSLSGLSDTTITNPSSGQVLSYDGGKWKNQDYLYYKNGTINIGNTDVGGWITSGRSVIRFTVPLPKKIPAGKTLTLGGKGRMYSDLGNALVASGTNLADWGTWTFNITESGCECLCTFDNAFSSSDVTNNTLQTIYLESTATLTISN